MQASSDQILTVAQMRAAEDALVAHGVGVDELMQRAGRGAAEWVWRLAAGRPVTVLCGPGNNGGDGYVIAEALREQGGKVTVVAATEPKTEAARNARGLYGGAVLEPDGEAHAPFGKAQDMLRQAQGDRVLVDCLFGSGLARPLDERHAALLARLAASHRHAIAIDVPSGVESDSGAPLNPDLPRFDLTLALGAWKFAHFLMPAVAGMGALRLVGIGVAPVPDTARRIVRPRLAPPAADSHKYRRGLLAVVGGAMPGAALLAARAGQGAGAGYVKLLAEAAADVPCDIVHDAGPLAEAIEDLRISALLAGPGLGRDAEARERLALALSANAPMVADADALVLLAPRLLAERRAPIIATPHAGELVALERAFDCSGEGAKPERALALARTSGMVVVAKGPDTLVAAPDGRLALAPRASAWLSTAGTGDVLAGVVASRLATGREPFEAACEGVWLHGEAARLSPPGFTAAGLAETIPAALAACF